MCLVLALTGCTIRPSRVNPIYPNVDYTKLGCAQIASKAEQIKSDYRDLAPLRQNGVRLRVAHLNGHVWKINEANRLNKCGFPDLLMPGQIRPGTRSRA